MRICSRKISPLTSEGKRQKKEQSILDDSFQPTVYRHQNLIENQIERSRELKCYMKMYTGIYLMSKRGNYDNLQPKFSVFYLYLAGIRNQAKYKTCSIPTEKERSLLGSIKVFICLYWLCEMIFSGSPFIFQIRSRFVDVKLVRAVSNTLFLTSLSFS